ncbi:MAG: FAD-dependent oxidoreductase [Planctomycetes bacterium]|nr:FAD-dependent oxidoreductase [Planctomycetota bacterium]
MLNVAVVGGGVSGIRAALTLARAGCRVTLFEKNRHLGGRVFSFPTPEFGEVDIGQHIWMRACTALEDLLHDLNVPDDWIFRQDRLSMPYRRPDGSVFVFGPGRLPGALAFLPCLLRVPGIGFFAKMRYLWGIAKARRYDSTEIERLDAISFADWLAQQRQPAAVVEWLWKPLVVGVCNARLDDVSARHGLHVARATLLKSPEASAICFLRRPLSDVFDRHARKILENAGVEVRTGAMVSAVNPGSPARVVSADEKLAFDKIILALPLKYMRGLIPGAALPEPPGEGAIAGLLLRFAKPVMDEWFFTAVDSPVQEVFNKTTIWGQSPEDGSQIIELVISAAEREVRLGMEGVAEELLPELAKLLPAVRTTPLLAKRLLVHGTATFRVPPGGESRRLPLTLAGLDNVLFAGDYAATEFPSTMESAARAGQAAAQAILRGLAAHPQPSTTSD